MSKTSILRVGVFGASGRVGKLVVEAVLAAPDLVLAAATVSAASPMLGKPVPGGDVVYGAVGALPFAACDVIVDFSRPAATMDLLDADRHGTIPLVIGTTGFDSFQSTMIEAAAHHRAVVLGANFGRGFPAFLRLASAAAAESGTSARISEIYHARKKKEPSGTSVLLARAVATASGRAAADVPIDVAREGETVGVNAVRLDFGPATIEIRYIVHSLASYAEGALAAARWAIGCKPGLHQLADVGQPADNEGARHDA